MHQEIHRNLGGARGRQGILIQDDSPVEHPGGENQTVNGQQQTQQTLDQTEQTPVAGTSGLVSCPAQGAHRRPPALAANHHLRSQNGYGHGEYGKRIAHEKRCATVFTHQIGHAQHIAQTQRAGSEREHQRGLALPRLRYVVIEHV